MRRPSESETFHARAETDLRAEVVTAWTFEPERGQHRRQLDNMGETGEEMKNGVICGSGKSAGENSACARNISLDALRVLCMFLIVFGHAMVHAHILPGCDHGSSSVAMSLKQIDMAKAAGIKTICATPHFYPHKESVASFITRRNQTADSLWAQIPEDAPRILLGAEVLICDGMERLNGLRELCLEGTNELLLEMPFYRWPESIWDTLYRLNDLHEIRIVIAHADRYPPEAIHQLISEGIPLQLNAECLRKYSHRKRYLEWIQKGYVSYLGSDIHELGPGYYDFDKCRKLLCHYF